MAMTFVETDTDPGDCTITGYVNSLRNCAEGASAGSTPVSITIPGSSTEAVLFKITVPGGTTKSSGTWTARLNVTTANMNLSVVNTYLKSVSAPPTCNAFSDTWGTDTTDLSLSSTGVKTATISANEVTNSNLLVIIFEITNSAMTDQTFAFTPNQNIDSPFSAAVFTPTANKYRFYDDDSDEANSTPLAAEDTNVTINVDSGNVPFQLRYRLQESGGVAGAATDDYDLQRSLNSGGYSTITGATTAIITSTSGLTNDAATTNRATNGITDGTGSFVAGEQSTDGVLDNWQLTASNYSEIVYGGTVVAADVNNGDTIDFRVTLNGGTPGMTNSVTPRITIQKTPPTTTQFFMLLGVGT